MGGSRRNKDADNMGLSLSLRQVKSPFTRGFWKKLPCLYILKGTFYFCLCVNLDPISDVDCDGSQSTWNLMSSSLQSERQARLLIVTIPVNQFI